DAEADRRQGRRDARVVGHLALLVHRDVEVDPDEDPLVLEPAALVEGAELELLEGVDVAETHRRLFGVQEPTSAARSIMRFEKPHSLSYQAKTFTIVSPRTWVRVPSTVLEAGLPM